MKSFIFATGNTHKTKEVQIILGNNIIVKDLNQLSLDINIIEDGETYEENADIKALTISQHTSEFVLSDDSGLAVQALKGAPGIRSARFAGENATMEENKALLLKKLKDDPIRKASFIAALSLARQGEIIARFQGTCHGHLLKEEKGKKGFGYDPLFIPAGYQKSFAELPPQVKNTISHRALALKQFIEWMASQS